MNKPLNWPKCLSDDELANLYTYVRLGNGAFALLPEEIEWVKAEVYRRQQEPTKQKR